MLPGVLTCLPLTEGNDLLSGIFFTYGYFQASCQPL